MLQPTVDELQEQDENANRNPSAGRVCRFATIRAVGSGRPSRHQSGPGLSGGGSRNPSPTLLVTYT